MGIRNLNRYLKESCPDSIRCINLVELSGKRIAVDISIYLYRYEAENALLENMYVMLSIFRHYNIIPIFIFDGKPPPEKKELLNKRKEEREDAQEEYEKLKKLLETNNEYNYKQDIITSMDKLKRQIVQMNKEKIEKVKALIRAYGATYYDAPGEADELCALLVIKKKVWACLSEDMDLFVYGCTRVLRYFSLIGHTVVLYYTKGILEELDMTQKEFKEVCILSGTDYNIDADGNNEKVNLTQTFKYFRKFKINNSTDDFYEWLSVNTEYISDIELLKNINMMFNLDANHEKLALFNKIKIEKGPIKQNEIENIMKEEDFIFCK
jgi:flap endonuclease-1